MFLRDPHNYPPHLNLSHRSSICSSSPGQVIMWSPAPPPPRSFPPTISDIIAFHPGEDCNNLTLLLQADTIVLWLIEIPSEVGRRCRSSLSLSLTGNPLHCFIDRRQRPLKQPRNPLLFWRVFYWAMLLAGIADRQSKGHPGITGDGIPVTVPL